MRTSLFLQFIAFMALFTTSIAVGPFSFTDTINGASAINNSDDATSGFNFQLSPGGYNVGQVDIDLTVEDTYAKAKDQAISGINVKIGGTTTGDGESVSSLDLKTYDTYATSRRDFAVAGIDIYAVDLINAPVNITFVADGNTAIQAGYRGGGADANAGVEFDTIDMIDSGLVTFNTTVRNNFARSNKYDAISGAEINLKFDNTDTSLYFIDDASNNVATGEKNVVAGIERNMLGTVSGKDVSVDINSNAQNNFARSKNQFTPALSEADDAYAGITNQFGTLDGVELNFNQYTKNNSANGDEFAVAGVRNEFREIYNTNQNNLIASTAVDNFAKSEEIAIAGVQNFARDIQSSTIVFDSQSTGNRAKDKYGVDYYYNNGAIAGVKNQVQTIEDSNVTFLDTSSNNRAVSQDSDAVAGVSTDITRIYNSDITINANTSDNFAKAKEDGDAIAGVYVDIYNMQDSNASIFAQSNDNKARAVDGNAIAGNKVLVQNSDRDSTVSLFLEAEGNKAISENGEAIVDNDVDVFRKANVVYLP